jgi:hypothetical protein
MKRKQRQHLALYRLEHLWSVVTQAGKSLPTALPLSLSQPTGHVCRAGGP